MIPPEAVLNARILIIEDDRISQKLLKGILETHGFHNIRIQPNPSHIVKVYKVYQPDLILLDLYMPRMNGFEAMAALRAAYPKDYLPILVISQEHDETIHLRALSSGAKDFLTKPYERLKVLVRCRNLIETKILHREVSLQNKDLEKLVRERTTELEKSRLDVILRLGHAAEYRDTDTGDHIVRMSRYCAALAKAMRLSPEECDLILNTSPLHDVGKIAIPDSILLKPGSLTPEEMEVMRSHARIGAELLSDGESPFLKMAETIALTHHEKWDGTGYPSGLKQNEIPFVGRICAICDVFDALTTERPYKKAWTFEAAIKEIRKMSGAHFDPLLVETFITIIPEIRAIAHDAEKADRATRRSQRASRR